MEGYSARQCASEDPQRCANFMMADKFSLWPNDVPTIFCYFLAAIPWLKVSYHVYGIKNMDCMERAINILIVCFIDYRLLIIHFSDKKDSGVLSISR